MTNPDVLISLKDLHERAENLETSDQPLPELTPVFERFCALREYWSMGRCGNNVARVQGSNDNELSQNGTPTMAHDGLVPYVNLTGASHLFHADAAVFDILGTEAFTAAGSRGLTLGGWFWLDAVAANYGLVSKWTAAGNDMAYLLYFNQAVPNFEFQTSNTGAAIATTVTSTAYTVAIDGWYFVVGRFNPSTSTDIHVNGVWDYNAVAAPAALFNSASELQVGSYDAGANELPGRVSSVFICAAQLTDQVINNAFQATRGLYGV